MAASHVSRRLYLCPPDYFEIEYSINQWMRVGERIDHGRAAAQWNALYEIYRGLGAEVEIIDPVPGLPELTFPGDSIFLFGDKAVPSLHRNGIRQREVPPLVNYFVRKGYTLCSLPDGVHFEGNAEAIYWNQQLLCGYGVRSDREAASLLGQLLDVQVHALEVQPPFFHLDAVIFPVDLTLAVFYPAAFNNAGTQLLQRLFPTLIAVDRAEALNFACNSICINGTVVMSTGRASRLAGEIRAWGYEVIAVELWEFHKAGAGVKCLTLEAYEHQSLHC